MWNDQQPILIDWAYQPVKPIDILYELDGPAIFTSSIGLSKFLFFKEDETEDGDLFLASSIGEDKLNALVEGRLSIRGALCEESAWLIEIDYEWVVVRYQHQNFSQMQDLLPKAGLALNSSFGLVPDSLAQANSFMSFKYFSSSMNKNTIPLSILTETVNNISKFVKGSLTPAALLGGRDSRFFDVRVSEPVFASLLIAIEAPEIDGVGLRRSKRTAALEISELAEASVARSAETWAFLKAAVDALEPGGSGIDAAASREFLENLVDLMPSEYNEYDRLEITLRQDLKTDIVSINREIGQRFFDEHEKIDGQTLAIEGVITEVNGESGTFLLRDRSYWITTCGPTSDLFQEMDDDGLMERGQRLRVFGKYWRRKRRGYLSFTTYPTIL